MLEFLKNLTTKGPSEGGIGGLFSLSTTSPPDRGVSELLRLYAKSPWLKAVVNKVGRAVAATDWRLYAARGEGGEAIYDTEIQRASYPLRDSMIKAKNKDELEEITTHPLLDVLSNGNEMLRGDTVMQVTQQHIDLVGEAFWLIERNQLGVPVAIWPLPPDWVMDIPTLSNPFYKISGGRLSATQKAIPATEVISFKDPNPADPYSRGSGIAKSLGDEIEIDEYAAKHMKAFFYNRARPDIIVSGDSIGREDAKRLEQAWLEKHQGFWKQFKPLFFSRKIDVKELTQSFESMQMSTLRKNERDAIINVYGIPPEKLGVIGESKRSTIAAADFFWCKDVIQPRVDHIRLTLQRRFVPQFDGRLILHFDSPVIQDQEFELRVMRAAPWAFTINDWRLQANKPSLGPAGDVLLVPMNEDMIPIGGEGAAKAIAAGRFLMLPVGDKLDADPAQVKKQVQSAVLEMMPLIQEQAASKMETLN